MVQKICIDSDIIIEISKNNQEIKEQMEYIEGEYSTTPINMFEVLRGEIKGENLDNFFESLTKLNFDEKSGRIASNIYKNLKKSGIMIDIRDMFIGAICIANNSTLWTYNKKHFERLKDFGLSLI